ncbi:hypothetical protein [Paenarthrobacter nitroguajacolicus]|uniref:hypothetical protein n=1 Tax=Paenarthrobacter nitroguajacolicus TaxID=211146 RepID=UPI0015BAFFC2|nr:hypothetical protein [Paenarthrobacter nitroguajacolicus]NWL32030.1 hypothetical protein [Paenarthrobacter nitroguajacolicus]
MTYDALAKFEDLWKRIDSTLNPQWQKDMANITNMYAKVAMPKLELPTLSGPKIQDIVGTHLSGLGQSPALNNALKAYGESLAYVRTQARLQEAIKGLSRPLDLGNLGGVTVWRDLLAADPAILRGVAEHAVFSTGISMPGGLTGALGPKASAAAGLYGFTRSDSQGVRLSEDRALGIVLEATELLSDEDRVAALADVEVDEELVEELEAFFLTSEASLAAYEAATREIVIHGPGPRERLLRRGMVVLAIYFVLYGFLIYGTADAKPGQEVTLADHQAAAVNAIQWTGGVVGAGLFVERLMRTPEDDEEDLDEARRRDEES